MKKLLSLIVFALISLVATAQVSKTINVATAGSLSSLLTPTELSTVTNLNVTGNIDARDVSTMNSMPLLAVLNLKGASITANVMPSHSFYNSSTDTGKTTLKTLTLPASLTSIGDYAFNRCSGITTLNLPTSLTSIGYAAFNACSGITILTLPASLTSIGGYAFGWGSGIILISLNPTPPVLDSSAFNFGCPSIVYVPSTAGAAYKAASGWSGFTIAAEKRVTINVPTAGSMAAAIVGGGFGPLNSITHLTVTGNLNSIDISQLKTNMTALTFIDISGASLGSNALPAYSFQSRVSLTSVILPTTLLSIGDYAFDGCVSLNGDIPLPESVTNVGAYAFQNCKSLTGKLTIPAGVTLINNYTFSGCSSLSGTLTIPSTITSIGSYAFKGCSSLTSALTISNTITSLGAYAFQNCSGFNGALSIGSRVTSIGNYTFNGCSGLSGNITIPNTVTSLGTNAFQNCSGFTGTLTLPNTINTVPEVAFAGCTQLSGKVEVPLSVTSIGASAFQGCAKITELSVGKNLATMGDNALNGCTSLAKISVPRTTPPTVYNNTFTGVPVETCFIDVATGASLTYQIADYWSMFILYTETLPADSYTITVTIGTGGGVKENNIALGNGSLLSAAIGSTKTFVITPNAGYAVATASYGGVNIKTKLVNNQYTTAAINTNATLNVTFSKVIYKISIQTGGSGAMNMSYNYGDTPSFDFTPSEGSQILSVFYNNVNVTANLVNNVYTLPAITANGTLSVNFTQMPVITMQVGIGGAVTENSVILSDAATLQVASGTSKIFTFVPTAGYEVATLSYGGVDVKFAIVSNRYTTDAVNADATLSVTFKKSQYVISVHRSSTDIVDDTYGYGATPAYDFTPAKNFKVQTLFYNGNDVTANLVGNIYTLPAISANVELVVNFVDLGTGAESLSSNSIKVYVTPSGIAVEGTVKDEIVALYTLNGKQLQTIVSQGNRIVFSIKSSGVYFVKTAEKSFKVKI